MTKLANNKALDNQTEARVVAMIARGDSYGSIAATLNREGTEIAVSTIGAIKRRNPEALAHMQKILLDDQTTHAQKILNKSRTLIDRRLTDAMKIEDDIAQLHEDYHDGIIDEVEYRQKFDLILRNTLNIGELNAVSKEAFSQSQIEAGKPTSITENPTQAKENLERLLRAIAANDTKGMLESVFVHA